MTDLRHTTPSDPLRPEEVIVASVCVECQAVQMASPEKLPEVLAALGRTSVDPHDGCKTDKARLERENEMLRRRVDRLSGRKTA